MPTGVSREDCQEQMKRLYVEIFTDRKTIVTMISILSVQSNVCEWGIRVNTEPSDYLAKLGVNKKLIIFGNLCLLWEKYSKSKLLSGRQYHLLSLVYSFSVHSVVQSITIGVSRDGRTTKQEIRLRLDGATLKKLKFHWLVPLYSDLFLVFY